MPSLDKLEAGVMPSFNACYTAGLVNKPYSMEYKMEEGRVKAFMKWRAEMTKMARHSVLMTQLHMILRLKTYAIRFRMRVHEPCAVLYEKSAKRFKSNSHPAETHSETHSEVERSMSCLRTRFWRWTTPHEFRTS